MFTSGESPTQSEGKERRHLQKKKKMANFCCNSEFEAKMKSVQDEENFTDCNSNATNGGREVCSREFCKTHLLWGSRPPLWTCQSSQEYKKTKISYKYDFLSMSRALLIISIRTADARGVCVSAFHSRCNIFYLGSKILGSITNAVQCRS